MIDAYKDFSKNRRASDRSHRGSLVNRRFKQENDFYAKLVPVDAKNLELPNTSERS